MKIRLKIFLYTTSIVMLVVTFAVFLLYLVMPIYYEYEKKDENRLYSEMVYASLKDNQINEEIIQRLNLLTRENDVQFYIFDQNKQLIYPNLQHLQLAFDAESSTKGSKAVEDGSGPLLFEELQKKNDEFYVIQDQVQLESRKKVTIFTVTPLQPVSDAKRVFLKIYPYILLISCLIGMIGSWIYSYFSTRRITEMIQRTAEMTRLKGTKLNSTKGKDELSVLAKNINYLYLSLREMIDKLDEENGKVADLERAKTEFMRIASHELKTPITALSGLVDGMIYRVGEFKDRDKYLVKCREILDEQADLVKDILSASLLDIDDSVNEPKWFDLKDQLSLDSAVYEILAKNKNISFHVQIEEQKVYGREEDFKKVLQNVLSNALKYTKEGGEISMVNEGNTLFIDNTCVGFTKEEASLLFDAFSRPDFARNRHDGGSGLGLFIVKQLVEKNEWQCSFEPKPDGNGMRFILIC